MKAPGWGFTVISRTSIIFCLTSFLRSDSKTVSLLNRAVLLPDKELRYLRTIIVIADIDRGLYSPAVHINTYDPPYLTFRHWSGITLYTLTYVFAESCVFVKQSPGNLSLRPHISYDTRAGLIPKLRPLFCRVP